MALWLAGGLLAGCGGAGGSGDRGGSGGGEPPASPLAEILGWGMAEQRTGGAPRISEVERQRHDRVEELIADCMAGHGFDYVPVSLEELTSGPFDEAYALPPAEFAARYGYGVTTLDAGDPVRDRNQEIRDSLSPRARENYQRAMWGDAATGGTGPEVGCQQRATSSVYGTESPAATPAPQDEFAELFARLDELWQRIESDPRLAGTEQAWTACMAESGHAGFARPHEARQSVFDRMAAWRARDEPDPAELAALRGYELALAPVDHRCREAHIDGPRREVAYELEAEFVATHRAELEAYRDRLAGQRPDGPGG